MTYSEFRIPNSEFHNRGAEVLEVAIGEGVVTEAPRIICSKGLGSCVVVTLYDAERRIGGLAHIMLPHSVSLNGHHTPYNCADTAIAALLKDLQSKGAGRLNTVAKMAGGGRMFSDYQDSGPGIGAENIMSIKQVLTQEQILLIGEDIGGHHGRNVEFRLDSGKMIVQSIGREDREI